MHYSATTKSDLTTHGKMIKNFQAHNMELQLKIKPRTTKVEDHGRHGTPIKHGCALNRTCINL